jgi:hypothetical protein
MNLYFLTFSGAESSERHGASVTALQSSLELQQAKHDETGEKPL